VAGGHDGRVILVLERCRAEVDQPYLCVQKHLPLTGRPRVRCTGRRYLSVVRKGLVLVVTQQYVLRLEIGVYQV
jgi:hypothetical protein